MRKISLQKIAIWTTFIVLAAVASPWADDSRQASPGYGESPGKIYVFGTGGRSGDGVEPSGQPVGPAVRVKGRSDGASPGMIYVFGTGGRAEAADQTSIVYTQSCGGSPGMIYVFGTTVRGDDERRQKGWCS